MPKTKLGARNSIATRQRVKEAAGSVETPTVDDSKTLTDLGGKSVDQHGSHKSRSSKLNFSDSPAYYSTVLHKYNSTAVFFRDDTEEEEVKWQRYNLDSICLFDH